MKDIQRGIVGGGNPPAPAQPPPPAVPHIAPQAQYPAAGAGAAPLPYPNPYMQPFFPLPPGYNPYNPYTAGGSFRFVPFRFV